MSDELLPAQPADGQLLDAQLHLLDRQVLDSDGTPVCVVDDVEVNGVVIDQAIEPGTPAPTLSALLSGPVLGTRLFGGRPPESRLHPIDWKLVADVGITVTLGVRGDNLDVTWTERWVRDRVIRRIPGGSHDPE